MNAGAAAQDAWTAVVRQHVAQHPQAKAQDLYKLLYQGTMGTEHAAPDPDAVERSLARELDAVEPRDAEPLTEPVDPEGRLVRLNLRPYKARGGSAAALARVFLQTAAELRPDPTSLSQVLSALRSADLGKAGPELRQFANLMSERGYPPVHHSDAYRESYAPAYRVVLARLLPELGLTAQAEPPAPAPAAP
jgi:hypothetical protein